MQHVLEGLRKKLSGGVSGANGGSGSARASMPVIGAIGSESALEPSSAATAAASSTTDSGAAATAAAPSGADPATATTASTTTPASVAPAASAAPATHGKPPNLAPARVRRKGEVVRTASKQPPSSSQTAAAPPPTFSTTPSTSAPTTDTLASTPPAGTTPAPVSAAATAPAAAPTPAATAAPSAAEAVFDAYAAAVSGRIDVSAAGALAERGIPDKLRGDYWKVLLGYLPPDSTQWAEALAEKRAQYRAFCEELIVVPESLRTGSFSKAGAAATTAPAQTSTPAEEWAAVKKTMAAAADDDGASDEGEPVDEDEDPLSTRETSVWAVYSQNKKLLHTIDVDVPRTMPSLHFFAADDWGAARTAAASAASAAAAAESPVREKGGHLGSLWWAQSRHRTADADAAAEEAAAATPTATTTTVAEVAEEAEAVQREDSGDDLEVMACMESTNTQACFTATQQRLRRLLYIFVKLNPGFSYVQGMNELAGHLFYTFANSGRKRSGTVDVWHAEVDAFYCFNILISHLGDHFCRTMDLDELGITGSIEEFSSVLRDCDPKLHAHLETIGLKPAFYAFRWLTLLLSQEFMVPDVLRVWDFLFADIALVKMRLCYTCAAMVLSLKEELMQESNFAMCMQSLQDFSFKCVDGFVHKAAELMERRGKR